MGKIDIISSFIQDRLTTCYSGVRVVDSDDDIVIFLAWWYHAKCIFSCGHVEKHGKVWIFGVEGNSKGICNGYEQNECDNERCFGCYHDLINRGANPAINEAFEYCIL